MRIIGHTSFLGETGYNNQRSDHNQGGLIMFWILHLLAILFGLWGLIITIPLHMIYIAIKNNNPNKKSWTDKINKMTVDNKPLSDIDYNKLVNSHIREVAGLDHAGKKVVYRTK